MTTAGGGEATADVAFLRWATDKDPVDWGEGLLFALLGVAGALVTVYLFLGESLPSMGGTAYIDSMSAELDIEKRKRSASIDARDKQARASGKVDPARVELQEKLTADHDKAISRIERAIARERRSLLLLGIPAYLVLGGFFATAFATNLLQAVLIGFAWTAVAQRIGLSRERAVRQELRSVETNKIAEDQRQLQTENETLRAVVKKLTAEVHRLSTEQPSAL